MRIEKKDSICSHVNVMMKTTELNLLQDNFFFDVSVWNPQKLLSNLTTVPY